MKTVFISFSSKESDKANELLGYLEDNGISCFISSRDLIPGQEYAEQLIDNISCAKAVVLLLSNASNNSPHVLREVEYAVSHRIPIVVFPLEDVVLSKSMEYFLMTHQWIPNDSNKKQALLDSVNKAISSDYDSSVIEASAQAVNGTSAHFFNDSAVSSPYATDAVHLPESTAHPADTPDDNPRKRNIPLIAAVSLIVIAFIACLAFIIKAAGTPSGDASTDLTDAAGIEKETAVSYSVGDTVTFGSYHDEPIEWRIIKINDDNTAVLLSKYILSMKVFDAAEGGIYNEYQGIDYFSSENYYVTDEKLLVLIRGNNDWSVSNIRTWLNSDKEVVNYDDQPPTKSAVGNNYYHSESGFLYDFTTEEKETIIKSVHESPANTLSDNSDGNIVKTEDYVFLLSSDELNWLIDAGISVYTKPTEQCKKHDQRIEYYNSDVEYNGTENYYWWLRDSLGDEISKSYFVTTEAQDELFLPATVGACDYGVRPAIVVDMNSSAIH